MEIALYVRVSTTRQQQNQTIEQQLERLRAEIAGHPDWHLAEGHTFRDDGYSGAKFNRPGLDRLRDQAAMAAFELVLMTAPDRLARNYVHQVLLMDDLKKVGCQVEFLERPMSEDPHDQLLLHIRGAVAEYERNLIAERMRRGRQAKLRSGLLLPWTIAPYGFVLDPERPRDPAECALTRSKRRLSGKSLPGTLTQPHQRRSIGWLNNSATRRFPRRQVVLAGMSPPSAVSFVRPPMLALLSAAGRARRRPTKGNRP